MTLEIKTIQEWIEYAEEIEETCVNGENVYDKKLVSIELLIKVLSNINTYPLNSQGVLVGKVLEELKGE